jgi:hypothetical protein
MASVCPRTTSKNICPSTTRSPQCCITFHFIEQNKASCNTCVTSNFSIKYLASLRVVSPHTALSIISKLCVGYLMFPRPTLCTASHYIAVSLAEPSLAIDRNYYTAETYLDHIWLPHERSVCNAKRICFPTSNKRIKLSCLTIVRSSLTVPPTTPLITSGQSCGNWPRTLPVTYARLTALCLTCLSCSEVRIHRLTAPSIQYLRCVIPHF